VQAQQAEQANSVAGKAAQFANDIAANLGGGAEGATLGHLDEARVRRAHATINALFAGYLSRCSGVDDPLAAQALEKLIDDAEAWEDMRTSTRISAVRAVLMGEIPAVYQRVVDGDLSAENQRSLMQDILQRTGLIPGDADTLDDMLDVLVRDEGYISETLFKRDDSGSATEEVEKPPGPVETAAYTVDGALRMLGVAWPHGRRTLMKARTMSDQHRAMALSPGSFGSCAGVTESSGQAELSVRAAPRGVTEFTPPFEEPSFRPTRPLRGWVGGCRTRPDTWQVRAFSPCPTRRPPVGWMG